MYHNLTNMELILKSNHSKKWNWFLEVPKYCPKLQNLTIHEVLLMSSYFFFFYTWTFFHLFYFIKQYLNLLQDSEYWMKLRILDKSNNFSWMPFNTSQNMFAWLQEISWFAAVLQGFSGGCWKVPDPGVGSTYSDDFFYLMTTNFCAFFGCN
jgi:hypothetical protein